MIMLLVLILTLIPSFIAFCYGMYHFIDDLVLGRSERPPRDAAFYFAACMFTAAFFYHLAGDGPLAIFDAIQMVGANMEYEAPTICGLLGFIVSAYGLLVYIFTPISTVILISTYLSELIAPKLVKQWSTKKDTFIFSGLDEKSLYLAHSISEYYRNRREQKVQNPHDQDARLEMSDYPCIVFSSVDKGFEEELSTNARGMGATCTARSVEEVVRWCSDETLCTVLLTSDDEATNISLAQRIKTYASEQKGRFDVYAFTSLRNSETLLFPEVLSNDGDYKNRVVVRGVDMTRELVRGIIEQYPLFLTCNPHSPWLQSNDAVDGATPSGSQGSDSQIVRMYEFDRRHIIVVGAGQLGMEFVTSALWASRIDGIHTCIDVIDREAMISSVGCPVTEGQCIKGGERSAAEARFNAMAPEIASHVCERWSAKANRQDDVYDLHFSCIDAESDCYTSFIETHAGTITYVFVSLGDDMLNARVAMRTRQVLERELIHRCANASGEERESYLNANRPLVMAVIEDNELTGLVEGAKSAGQPYDIVCVGRTEAKPTYEGLLQLRGSRDSEYNRRSHRSNKAHAKCRLFAWLRNSFLGLRGISPLGEEDFLRIAREIDWTKDPQGQWEIVREYERYRLTEGEIEKIAQQYRNDGHEDEPRLSRLKVWTHALKQDSESAQDEADCRQWLLEMEHSRWNAYLRTEGFRVASRKEVAAFFNTGQVTEGDKLHRSNLAGMHPCLVPFEELKWVTEFLQETHRMNGSSKTVGDMRLQDDQYVSVSHGRIKDLVAAKKYLDILIPPEEAQRSQNES